MHMKMCIHYSLQKGWPAIRYVCVLLYCNSLYCMVWLLISCGSNFVNFVKLFILYITYHSQWKTFAFFADCFVTSKVLQRIFAQEYYENLQKLVTVNVFSRNEGKDVKQGTFSPQMISNIQYMIIYKVLYTWCLRYDICSA